MALLVANKYVFAQNNGCPNLNFSLGNFSNWIGLTGSYSNCCPTPGIVSGRHTIISSQGLAPFTCGGLSLLPPGTNTVARLGNSQIGGEAERLRYNLVVDSSNTLFIYKYAVVLEDPGHDLHEQPKFDLRILNSSGNVVHPICGQYSVTAASNLPGWQTCNGVVWKDWTTVGLDLSPLMGQQISIEFTTYDCLLLGHFGHAYITAECGPSIINVDYCLGDTTVLLTAPDGFTNYLWSNGANTQSTIIQNPVLGTTFNVVMTAVNGCNSTLTTSILPTTLQPSFVLTDSCMNNSTFQDQSTTSRGSIINWIWDFGDNSNILSGIQNPSHNYTLPGSYNVTLITQTDFGCLDTISETVNIIAIPNVNFSFDSVCAGYATSFLNNSTSGNGSLNYTWDFGDGASSNDHSPQHIFNSPGNYNVQLYAENLLTGCGDSLTTVVTIQPPPIPEFLPLPSLCELDPPISLNNFVTVNQIGNGIYSGIGIDTTYFNPAISGPGTHTIFYQYFSTLTSCDSIIESSIIVYPMPQADFIVNDSCVNNTQLSDNSQISVGSIVDWTWNFGDNTPLVSGISNPNHVYSQAGNYYITLIVTSNEGCMDTVQRNISILEKPQSNFQVQTSCVGRPIQFDNLSVYSLSTLNSIWSFGDGTTSLDTNPIHTYSTPGFYYVSLISISNGLGCADTIESILEITEVPEVLFLPLPELCESDTPFNLTSYVVANQNGSGSFSGQGINNNFFDPQLTGEGVFNISYSFTSSINNCDSIVGNTIIVNPDPVVVTNSFPRLCVNWDYINLHSYFSSPNLPNANEEFSGIGVIDSLFYPTLSNVGTFTIDYTSINPLTGCKKLTSQLISIVDTPSITIPNEIGVCYSHYPFKYNFASPSGGIYFSEVIDSNGVVTPDASNIGSFEVQYVYFNSDNCEGRGISTLRIEKDSCDCLVFIPNSFTPNHDGLNDYYFPASACNLSDVTFQIFNRWGEMVFESFEITNGWDGNHNGQHAPSGLYLWKLSYVGEFLTDFLTPNSKKEFMQGTVVLVR